MQQNRQEDTTSFSTNSDSSFHLGRFILKTLLLLIPILLFLSLVCYKTSDLAILEGGRNGIIENDIGYLGASISRFFFYTFGFASYYIIIISLLVFVRWMMPVPRKIIHGYFIGILCIMLGIVMLMAMWPENYIMESDSYGIGR